MTFLGVLTLGDNDFANKCMQERDDLHSRVQQEHQPVAQSCSLQVLALRKIGDCVVSKCKTNG